MKSIEPTQKHNESPADFIRRMGWEAGTVIIGTNTREHTVAVEISAIGINAVLGRPYCQGEPILEGTWTFKYRNWVKQ
jgi:hypothetical protein